MEVGRNYNAHGYKAIPVIRQILVIMLGRRPAYMVSFRGKEHLAS